jgi:hypothetical protein
MEKYIVVEIHNLNKFLMEVNKKINQGYLPLGGIECPVRDLYVQAMILKDVKCTD